MITINTIVWSNGTYTNPVDDNLDGRCQSRERSGPAGREREPPMKHTNLLDLRTDLTPSILAPRLRPVDGLAAATLRGETRRTKMKALRERRNRRRSK